MTFCRGFVEFKMARPPNQSTSFPKEQRIFGPKTQPQKRVCQLRSYLYDTDQIGTNFTRKDKVISIFFSCGVLHLKGTSQNNGENSIKKKKYINNNNKSRKRNTISFFETDVASPRSPQVTGWEEPPIRALSQKP